MLFLPEVINCCRFVELYSLPHLQEYITKPLFTINLLHIGEVELMARFFIANIVLSILIFNGNLRACLSVFADPFLLSEVPEKQGILVKLAYISSLFVLYNLFF